MLDMERIENAAAQLEAAVAKRDAETVANLLNEVSAWGGSCSVRDVAKASTEKSTSNVAYQIEIDGDREKLSILLNGKYSDRAVASITLSKCAREK